MKLRSDEVSNVTIRVVVILFVAAIILAVFYHDPIYRWIKDNLINDKKNDQNETSETEDKENKK